MNSEELELSLRTEFESYLKGVLAEMRQDAEEFQSRIEAEFDKQKSQFDDAFKSYSAHFDADRNFDGAFKETVIEHLRLAKDEGAKISANAFAEAEDMQRNAAPQVSYSELRDAVNDISSNDSQSSILKSLVVQAAHFAPRGAFFIVKSEQFVGWKVFGDEADASENAIRELHFPISSDTVLGNAVRSRSSVESAHGSHPENEVFLGPLQFGQPDRMYAIPLLARGRGVAVMYVDYGTSGVNVNLEAIETLVRVAGLTIELLASSQTAAAENRTIGAADFEDAQPETGDSDAHAAEAHHETPEAEPADFAFSESVPVTDDFPEAQEVAQPEHDEPLVDDFAKTESFEANQPIDETTLSDELSSYYPAAEVEDAGENDGAMVFESGGSIEPAVEEQSPFDHAAEQFEQASIGSPEPAHAMETAVEALPGQVAAGRLSDRPVDLPIDVPDDERRSHNDARRFARLLVSEIKLYNEKKVIEGRQAGDLYDRLREAIDRSREMYDKRVQPPVAAKFDYFHYELVSALADGEVSRLGPSYSGGSN